jgi:hypothetical protein
MDYNGMIISAYTDTASSVTGFASKIGEVNSEIKFDYCLVYREAIAAKTFPGVLNYMLEAIIKTATFIVLRPFHLCFIFFVLRPELGSEPTSLLLHMDV